MKNIEITQKDHTLTIKVDMSKEFGRSKSGKTIIIATTGGNKEVAEGIHMGLNIYKYPE
ncbi:MAG: hypothetical protein U9N19_06690 [Thermodesulfobacteriota bacterium]|nr:hypothetical protein [Thermodesulfobacteriota bacterium]